MANRKCIACHADMDPDAIFCNECGLAQAAAESSAVKPISKEYYSISEQPPTIVRVQKEIPPPPEPPRVRSCPECGKQCDLSARFCSRCAFDFSMEPKKKHEAEPTRTFVSRDGSEISEQLHAAVKKRYRDGYRVARAINGYGSIIKSIGFLLGLVICFAGLIVGGGIAEQASRGPFGGQGAGAGIVIGFIFVAFGFIVGTIFWIIGVIYMAQAQKLKASLDGAVNSSPFLSDLDRADMMSLPIAGLEKKTMNNSSCVVQPAKDASISTEINENVRAAAGYATGILFSLLGLWGLLLVPVYIYLIATTNQHKFAHFNAYQSLILSVAIFGLGILIGVASAASGSMAIGLFYIVIIIGSIGVNIFCLTKAYQSKMFVIPLIGDLAISLAGRKVNTEF